MGKLIVALITFFLSLVGILFIACTQGSVDENKTRQNATCEPPLIPDENGNCVQLLPGNTRSSEDESTTTLPEQEEVTLPARPPPLPPQGQQEQETGPTGRPGETDEEDEPGPPEETETLTFSFRKPTSDEYDLSNFPRPFILDSKRNYSLVRSNDSAGVGCQINLAGMLDSLKAEAYNQEDLDDSDRLEEMQSQNLVILGSPCTNRLASQILNNPIPCNKNLDSGKGYVKLYVMNNKQYALLIMGNTSSETLKACKQIGEGTVSLEGTEDEFTITE
ncbi:MAG: hypothetical protein V1743_05625 [Nanoarchaeota archaeon]